MMNKNKNISIGISYGLIIGLIYCILLFWRWNIATNIIEFGVVTIVNYLIILGILFYEAYSRRKLEGGFIDFKNLLQTLFISVLIFEFFYSLFNFIYLKYIDPDIINKMIAAMNDMLNKAGSNISDEQRKDSLSKFDDLKKLTDVAQILKSYITSIAVSGVFAFLITLIMKKKKSVFEEFT